MGPAPIETRSRLLVPFLVKPPGTDLTLVRDKGKGEDVVFGEPLALRAKVATAKTITVTHKGRTVGTITGPEGTVSVDTRSLGMGPVMVAGHRTTERHDFIQRPAQAQRFAPGPAWSRHRDQDRDLLDGIAVKIGDKEPAIVSDTKEADWLEKISPGADQPLLINAIYEAPADSLYQLQFEGNSLESVRVDGETVWQLDKGADQAVAWTMVPLNLKKGLHRFTIKGTTSRTPRLQLRFGDAGCLTWNGSRFKHEK